MLDGVLKLYKENDQYKFYSTEYTIDDDYPEAE